MNDQARQIGHGRGPGLLAPLAVRQTRHKGHEVAQRLGVVEQLAQLHADPGRVDHPHVERQQPGQAVERARVVARETDRAGPGHGAAVRAGQRHLFQGEGEGFAGGRVVDIDRPGQGARRPGEGFVAAEHGVHHRCRQGFGHGAQGLELLAAPADDRRGRRDDARKHAQFAMRRKRHLERALLGHGGQRVELELQPGRVVGAQVHRQRFGQCPQAARLLGAVDPDLEGLRRPPVFTRQFAHEQREIAEGVMHHEGPGGVARGQLGPARPTQGREHGGGQSLQCQAAVGVIDLQRCRRRRRGDAEHRAQHRVGPVGGQSLEAGLPGFEVQVLEVLIGVVGRHIDGL